MIEVFINVLFPVLLIFSIGYLLGRFFSLDNKTFSTLSIYILTPALIFISVYQYKDIFTLNSLKIFLAVTVIIIVTIAGVELFARIFKFSKSLKIIITLCLVLTNSGNFGLPICEYAFGSTGVYIASLLLVIYIFYTHSLGVFVAASDKNDRKSALINMLKVPVFYALIIALVISFFKIELPKQLLLPLKSVGQSAIPINLLIVGINLSKIKINKNITPVMIISAIKVLIVPIVAIFILKLFIIKGMDFKVSLTQIAMPSAVYSSILAGHYESDSELASEIVLVSLLMSIFSLSLIIFLLNNLII